MEIAPAVTTADERRILRAFGEEVRLHLTGEQTGGRYTQWTEVTPPGGGPPPHYHTQEDEWFYVIEGMVSFLKDGEWSEVGPGSGAFMPRNCVHTFKNTGDIPLHMIVTTSPAGFEVFFSRCAKEFAEPNGPNMEQIMQIAAEHGIHFVAP